MELNSFEGGKDVNEDMLICDSTLRQTESCDHFSIREYVAQASERDPEACSPFKSGKPNPSFHFRGFLPKKFKRWDCDNCTSKLVKDQDFVLSSDQSANNASNNYKNNTSCSISFLGTTLVPHRVNSSGGTVPVPVTEQDSNQETQEDAVLSELTKPDLRQLAQEHGSIKAQIESEKSKEIEEIMANTPRNNTDLNFKKNQDLNIKSNVKKKMHRQKSRKVRSLAEIIGSDEPVLPRKPCRNDDHNVDLTSEREKRVEKGKEKENCPATIAYNNSGAIKEKVNKSKKKYKTVGVVDETASLISWLKKTSKRVKKPKKNSAKRNNFRGENVYMSGKEISAESSEQGRIKEKENDRGNIVNVVKKKRTKKPRKCLQLQGSAIIGEISDNKSFSKKISKKLHHGGIREPTCDMNSSKNLQEKSGNKNSKRSGTEVQKVHKKRRKISDQKNSNDLSMDIVELLAKSLQDKHLTTNEKYPNSNLNSNVMPQIKPGTEKLTSIKSSFSNYNNSGAGTSKTVQNPQIGQSSNYHAKERNFDLNRVIIEPNRAVPVLNPNNFGYSKQQYGNNYAYNLPPNLVPVVQVPTRNDLPATHLLQLMDASSLSNSYLSCPVPNPNFVPRSQFRPIIAPINVNHHNQQHLMQNYLHRNPCALFKPLPRFGVLGSLLQQEITSPKQNCGTQSGYRIGDLNLNLGLEPPPYNTNSNCTNNDVNSNNVDNNSVSNSDNGKKGGFEEGICVINRNPADFTEVDENNEYMRWGENRNPKFVGGFYGVSNGVVYNIENNVRTERGFNNRRFLYNNNNNNAAVH